MSELDAAPPVDLSAAPPARTTAGGDPTGPGAAPTSTTPAEPERVGRIRDYIKRNQLKGARRRPARQRPAAEPWWARVSWFRAFGGLIGILATFVPLGLLWLVDQASYAPGAPPFLATLRTAWLALIVGLLAVGAVIGVLAYAGPNWRRWVRMDQADERIEGTPRRAEFTTRYRLRQILVSLVSGLVLVAWLVWQGAPLVAELGALPTAALLVGIAFLHIGFVWFGIAGYGYFLEGHLFPTLLRAGYGLAIVAAGTAFAWAGLAGRLDWLTTVLRRG